MGRVNGSLVGTRPTTVLYSDVERARSNRPLWLSKVLAETLALKQRTSTIGIDAITGVYPQRGGLVVSESLACHAMHAEPRLAVFMARTASAARRPAERGTAYAVPVRLVLWETLARSDLIHRASSINNSITMVDARLVSHAIF